MTVGRLGGDVLASRRLSTADTNSALVKNAAGQLFGWQVSNVNAAARFLKLYNKATAPIVGTDVPVMTILLPAGSSSTVDLAGGVAFSAGIGIGLTTGVADADTGAVAANEIVVHLFTR